MTFKSRKIRKKPPRKRSGRSVKVHIKHKSKFIATLGSLFIIIFLVFSIYRAIASINFNWAVSLFSQSLPTDSFGHTNFLLLGVGGGIHEGPDLTDTIIIASMDSETGDLSLLSIPRDLYVKDTNYPGTRVNQVYSFLTHNGRSSDEALKETSQTIETLVGMPIHYYGKVNFKAVIEMVDILGGIDVLVEETINDPLYPKDGTFGYEPFYIEKGMHHLDGETTLKYVRSRQTSSDFSRSKRQQQAIFAIKEKALSTELLSSIGKINEILENLGKNIETNINPKEVLHLGTVASKFSKNKFSTHVIHDDPSRCGGFLYSPMQDLYGGAFVLTPAGGQTYLSKYMQLVFSDPSILKQNHQLQILNGTKETLLAAKSKVLLSRHCFNVRRYGNARNQKIQKTTYFIKNMSAEQYKNSETENYINFLKTMIPGEVSFDVPKVYLEHPYQSASNIIIELGADYLPNAMVEPFDYITDMQPVGTKTTKEEDEETESKDIEE